MTDNNYTVRTPVVRLSYANLVEPRQYKENGKPKGNPTYNCELLIPVDKANISFELRNDEGGWDSIEDFKEFLMSVSREEWGSDFDVNGAVKHGGMKWPVQSGDKIIEKKEKKTGKKAKNMSQYEGVRVLRVKSVEQWPPRLYVRSQEGIVLLDRDKEEDMKKAKKLFQSGNYGILSLNLKCNEVDGRKFLTFYINDVLYDSKGGALGGADGNQVFAGYEGGESDTDPTQGMDEDPSEGLDDEIPF